MGDYKDKNGTTRIGDFLRGLKDVSPEILSVVGTVTGVSGLGKIGDLIKGTNTITEKDKEIALEMLKLDIADAREVTKRWEADTKTNYYLPNNIRPLSLAFLTLSLIVLISLDSALETFTVKEQWIDLLSILLLTIYAAYFGGRSLEKIRK